MKSKKIKSDFHHISQSTVCANELTGWLQNISLDPEEVKRFHDEYIGDK